MPLAIDAAIALADLGVPYASIIELCPVISKSNLNPCQGDDQQLPTPHTADARFGREVAATETVSRRKSHAGVLFHNVPGESMAIRMDGVPQNCEAKHSLSPEFYKGSPCTVILNHTVEHLCGDESLTCRAPMIERSLSPTDMWLATYKGQNPLHVDQSLQEVHVRDAEQVHPTGILVHSSIQSQPGCTNLGVKGGLHAMQQPSRCLSVDIGTTPAKRRKLTAVRLPFLEQEQDAPNSGDKRHPVGSGVKRNQPDSSLPVFKTTLAQRPQFAKAYVPESHSLDEPERAALSHGHEVIMQPSAVSHVTVSERQEILERQGLGWLGLVVAGHAHLFKAANREAVREFSAAAALFPHDITSMLSAATALLAAGDHVGAISTFQRARILDPLNVRGMDVYACLLLDQGNHDELRMLSHSLLDVDLEMPEVWAVMAYFWLQKSESDKALEYVERCFPQPVPSSTLQGLAARKTVCVR